MEVLLSKVFYKLKKEQIIFTTEYISNAYYVLMINGLMHLVMDNTDRLRSPLYP